MLSRHTTLGLLCLLAANRLAAAPASDRATAAAHTEIQQMYQKRDNAIAHKDAATLWRVRTDDYVVIGKDGRKQDATVLKAKEAKLFAMAKSLQGSSAIQTTTLRGDGASVVVNESGTVVLGTADSRQESILKTTGQYLDSWIKTGAGWRLRQSETLSSTTTLDGHPIEP